nr:hypothetical protein [Tanacetum cinerariifolium]
LAMLTRQCSFDVDVALPGPIRSVIRCLEGKMMILEEVFAGQLSPKVAKKSKALVKRKASTSLVGPLEAGQPKRKRRLKKKASEARSSSPVMEQDEDVKDVDLSKTGYCAYLEGNLERTRVTPLEPLSSLTCDVLSNPSHADTSNAANAPSSNDADVKRVEYGSESVNS